MHRYHPRPPKPRFTGFRQPPANPSSMPSDSVPPSAESTTRCSRVLSDGRRCTMFTRPAHPTLCQFHHNRLLDKMPLPPTPEGRRFSSADFEPQISDFPADLLGPMEDFRTLAAINHALGKLAILLAGKRIAPRRAAVLAYTFQLLLQTVSEAKEDDSTARNASPDVRPAAALGARLSD